MSSKLLMIHQGALGDFIQTFPSVRLLRKKFNQIDAFCQNKLGKMALDLQVIDACFPIEAPYFSSLFSHNADHGMKKILKSYPAIIVFSFSASFAQEIRAVSEKPVYHILPRPDVRRRIHVAEYVLRQLIKCGLIETPGPSQGPILSWVEHEDRRDKSHDPTRIILHPGSGSRKKNWPIQNFLKMERILISNSFNAEYILGPAEISLEEKLQEEKDPNTCIHGVEDLTELVELLKTSGGFIGNDSGVSHLAAFIGLPTVAVFGPSDPQRWKPIGRAVKVIWSDPDCGPCFETGDKDCNDMGCFQKITADMVMKAFLELYPHLLQSAISFK